MPEAPCPGEVGPIFQLTMISWCCHASGRMYADRALPSQQLPVEVAIGQASMMKVLCVSDEAWENSEQRTSRILSNALSWFEFGQGQLRSL
jgi:hypothetical protein